MNTKFIIKIFYSLAHQFNFFHFFHVTIQLK